ncbi:MAG TPA: Ig-like domain repeat protein, partial [Acidimicrobiales bacterium]|nr:Ig-like domain repeat protein [Acidimicrobiales bacterium]
NDTWVFNGASWSQVADSGDAGCISTCTASPPGRVYASMAFDAATGDIVLFGGQLGFSGPGNDTWVFDGANWSQVADTGDPGCTTSCTASPPGRLDASMAYDAVTGDVVLFGGGLVGGLANDTWVFDGANWSQVADTGDPGCTTSCTASPLGRGEQSMAYDTATSQVLLFGGWLGYRANDTWALSTAPAPPVSLGLISAGNSASLSWTAPMSDGGSTVTGYNVYEGTSPGAENSTPLNATLITSTNYLVGGLAPGSAYFVVEAVNAVGNSPPSNEVTISTQIPPESLPSSTLLSVDPPDPILGQSVSVTAVVSDGGTGPAGWVTFYDSTKPLAVLPLSGGRAVFVISSLDLGTHSLTGNYSGYGVIDSSISEPVDIVVVSQPPPPPLNIVNKSLPEATLDSIYTVTLAATGGTPPLSWSMGKAGLPPGLSLSSSGSITGAPVTAGTFTINVEVSDSSVPANTSDSNFTFVVNPSESPPAITPGYIVTSPMGAVSTFGGVAYHGSLVSAGVTPVAAIVGDALTSDNAGYWLVGADGGVFTFGDALFYGSCPGSGSGCRDVNAPVVGIVATPDGKGYWLVGADGGVFTFGDMPRCVMYRKMAAT